MVTMRWRSALRGQAIVLPLALGCVVVSVLAIDQGYGWGYRYLHGYVGSFALLAGYGWQRIGIGSLRTIWVSALLALLTGTYLARRTHDYVQPYAQSHRAIMNSGAQVVLVDPRGGRFVTDVVRGSDGNPLTQPVVMNLGWLTIARLDQLCARYDVAIFDQTDFLPLGVGGVRWGNAHIARLRARMAEIDCGRPIALPR
jgi:hypothetical protein